MFEVACAECGTSVPYEMSYTLPEERQPCTNCGSTERSFPVAEVTPIGDKPRPIMVFQAKMDLGTTVFCGGGAVGTSTVTREYDLRLTFLDELALIEGPYGDTEMACAASDEERADFVTDHIERMFPEIIDLIDGEDPS